MTLEEFNQLNQAQAFDELFKCCGSTTWAKNLSEYLPFDSKADLLEKADIIWSACTKEDGLEAFTHHPKIGDVKSLSEKFASTKAWAGGEQAGVNQASQQTIEALAKGNQDYEAKFGFIFIVCATGKSAEEMLALLEARIHNDYETELQIAMAEQHKITHIRIEKLIP